ncbi:MAG: phage tail assembly protein [Candidatus Margulisiibacteriota bacterium]
MKNFKDIELSSPIEIDGTEIAALRMREPTVADQLAADAVKGGDSAKEVNLFANLCEITPDTIKRLTLKDYKKVQEAFVFFTSD